MECEWKQGQYHRAKIIERRKRSDAPDYEYYVHYIGCECLLIDVTLLYGIPMCCSTPTIAVITCITMSYGSTDAQNRGSR